MAGIDEEARRIALEMISILVVKPGDFLKISKFSTSFPGVDADEVAPGIFIGNKYFLEFIQLGQVCYQGVRYQPGVSEKFRDFSRFKLSRGKEAGLCGHEPGRARDQYVAAL